MSAATDAYPMRKSLVEAARRRGVLTRAEALAIAPRHVVTDAVTDGVLHRVYPGVYALPGTADDETIRRRAALALLPDAALSHIDGLAVWALPGEAATPPEVVHLTRGDASGDRRVPGLLVHRQRGFRLGPPLTVVRDDLRVVRLEQAIIGSWPLLTEVDRRLPAIVAVRDRRTTSSRLLATLDRQPRVSGAAQMRDLFGLLGFGVHSHLEAWGHAHVFSDPRLPASRAQVPIDLPSGRRVYLDRLFDDELVNVELDGAAYHGEPGQRERDLRRDAALASLGFVTLRFSHLRLHRDTEAVIQEVLATLTIRRRQLGLSA